MNILEIKNLSLSICREPNRPKKILRSINLNVPIKGITAILGPSGTGKSTILRTLAGLNDIYPDIHISGEILYKGQDLFVQHQKPVLVEQKIKQFNQSVKENVLSHLPYRAAIMFSEQNQVIEQYCEKYQQHWLMQYLQQPVYKLERYQQRLLAIFCAILSEPALLMLDEPTAGLDDNDALLIRDLILKIAETTPVLIVSHHIARIKRIANYVALMANGTVQEYNDTTHFFQHPAQDITRQYLKTGSCAELSEEELDVMEVQQLCTVITQNENTDITTPDAMSAQPSEVSLAFNLPQDIPHLDHDFNAKSHYIGPRGFVWLIRGRLAGTPQAGIVRDVADDLADLKAVGVTHLISLTEDIFDPLLAAPYGITVSHYSIVDMQAPTIDLAHQFCLDVTDKLLAQKVVAIHCKAGLGRTGTMLAVYDLWLAQGKKTAQQAISHIRSLNGLMIQSTVQTDFLEDFALYLGNCVFNH